MGVTVVASFLHVRNATIGISEQSRPGTRASNLILPRVVGERLRPFQIGDSDPRRAV